MPYSSLGGFLAELQDHGELVRIAAPVDSALELAAISDRVTKRSQNGGPALLFENVKNTTIPIVTNLLGSSNRICRCLGLSNLDELASNLDRQLRTETSSGWLGSLLTPSSDNRFGKWSPKSIKTGTCQQVVKLGRDVNLWDLPVPRSWPDELFPVITSGQIATRHCGTGRYSCFQTPLVVSGQQEIAWYDGTCEQQSLLEEARRLNQNLPVAISLGSDPVLQLGLACPGVDDPRAFAGFLRGESLEFVRCRTNELEVPATSEIVIEGYVDAANPRSATPLSVARGNGRYVQRELPLIQVTAVTHRANPVLPATIVAAPPCEESWITRAADRMLLPFLQRLFPEIVDIRQPFSSANRNLLFVSIRKHADHDAKRVLHALWGIKSIGQTKMMIVVDADQDLRCESEVWFRVGTHACPRRDFLYADGLARDDDYSTSFPTLASHVGIDATRKQNQETNGPLPRLLKMPDEVINRICEHWTEYGLAPEHGLKNE